MFPASAQAIDTWYWLNPQPQGSSLNDVRFIDTDTGWAVGDAGTIIHTADAGVTWAVQRLGAVAGRPSNFNAVHFTDADTGWAVGSDGGPVLHTTDGGETWVVQDIAVPGCVAQPSFTLEDVHFIDATTGWAVGFCRPFPTFRFVILRTNDGGANWDIVGNPPGVPQNGEPAAVFFIDADTGWAVVQNPDPGGPGIFRTVDGGDSWTPAGVPGASDIFFTAADAGYAVTGQGEIWFTADGGDTWEVQNSESDALTAIDFADADTGYAVGDGLVVRTFDAGQTWIEQSTDFDLSGVSVPDVDTVTAVGDLGAIIRTEDGETWVPQWGAFTAEVEHLTSVSFIDADTGWVVGNDFTLGFAAQAATIMHTANGGITWTKQDFDPPVTEGLLSSRLDDVHFIDEARGWAVGSYTFDAGGGISSTSPLILHTIDGGGNWEAQDHGTDLEARLLLGVYFVDQDQGWAVGGASGVPTVLQTTDGGNNWIFRNDIADAYFDGRISAVFFIDANTGWMAGAGGVIVRTDDGGKSWTAQSTVDTTSEFNSIFFLDADTGWVAGERQGIHRTTDGGETWVQQFDDTNAIRRIVDVAFADVNNGIVIGRYDGIGWILHTDDGGDSWQSDWPTGQALSAVAMSDSGNYIVVGENGAILRGEGEFILPGALQLAPDLLDFGVTLVGETAGPADITLTNTGGSDVIIDEISQPKAPFAPAGGTCADTLFALEPGEECTLAYTFSPDHAGSAGGSITITSDATGSPHTLILQGIGEAGPGILEIDPTALDFGEVHIGKTLSLPFGVSNVSETDAQSLELSLLDLVGNNFALTGGDCAVGEVLVPGERCAVEVTFSPDAEGTLTGEIRIETTDGQNETLALSGVGTEFPEPLDPIFTDRFEQ